MNFRRKRRKQAGIRYENNLNAPRMSRKAYTTHLITKELHAKWQETSEHKISFQEMLKIWVDIAEVIQEETVSNPEGVRLGFYTGELRCNYVNKYEEVVDEDGSNQVGKDIPEENWNTNGKLGKVIWSIDYARKRNKRIRLYSFTPCRPFSRIKAYNSFKTRPEIFKDNRVNKFQVRMQKDKNNPWLHGMEILNKKDIEPTTNKKRGNLFDQEESEGD